MLSTMPIRIVIVDDNQHTYDGLVFAFNAYEGFELIGHAANGTEAILLCVAAHPDVILMDLLMPGLDGITATRIIHKQHPEIQIIGLTNSTEPKVCRDLVEAGATTCLFKDTSMEKLIETIRWAYAAGEHTLTN